MAAYVFTLTVEGPEELTEEQLDELAVEVSDHFFSKGLECVVIYGESQTGVDEAAEEYEEDRGVNFINEEFSKAEKDHEAE